jgi:DNA-binding CsgD family transcriptional regulator
MASMAPPQLLGRRSECEALDCLLGDVREGKSRTLVLLGEPGIGKTALLEYAIARATGFRVAQAAGTQSEMELGFAGLHQLCAPMLDRLHQLPEPQRDALGTAFGLTAGNAPDRFFVGLAVLNLLSETAASQPLLCVVDDAQWLDLASAQALALVARRLGAESVGVLFAIRDRSEMFARLPELVVHRLRKGDARALLDSVITGPLDQHVRDRLVAETRGNPLAVLELPRGLTPAELAGGFGRPDAMPLTGLMEKSFRRRLDELPLETRRFSLLAAAEPVGDPALLHRAAERCGISADAAAPALAAGLLDLGLRATFRHPLVRSTAYRAATPQDRQAAHRALAEATDLRLDPDRRAWHRAQASPGPDEAIASELDRSADRARARGGLAAAAAFLERSAELTLEPAPRAERTLAAAQAKHLAGAPDVALELLAGTELGPLDELQRARVDLLRAQIAFASSRGGDSPTLLLKAAKKLESLDLVLAREAYLDALSAAIFVGRLASSAGVLEVAKAALASPASSQPARPSDFLLDGLALLIAEGHAAGTPSLRRALDAFLADDISEQERIRWLWLACHAAGRLWDYETQEVLSDRQVHFARGAGALTILPIALIQRIGVHVHAGELAAAASLSEEVEAVTEATGSQLPNYGALALAGWKGGDADARRLINVSLNDTVARSEGTGLTFVHWARAVLYNGLGRYEDALIAARQAAEGAPAHAFSYWAVAELIEAASRTANIKLAEDALRRLTETTQASRSEWALGFEARSRALLGHGDATEGHYRDAIDHLGRTPLRPELARAHLVYGEWLRREKRRIDARQQLRTAHEMFEAMGMQAFTARAASELLATGETARQRRVQARGELTPQEAQITRLARDGLSNAEIASRLFISPRTVEYHLHKVFGKLGIRSRNQLHRALARDTKTTPRTGSNSA